MAAKRTKAFVIYRLPGESVTHSILPESNDIVLFDEYQTLTNDSGFVFHPFVVDDDLPGIFFRSTQTTEASTELSIELQSLIIEHRQSTSLEEYSSHFTEYMNAFRRGNIQKAILSKLKLVEAIDPGKVIPLFYDLCEKYRNAFVYVFHLPGFATWIGASPELLLARSGTAYRTISLAGTKLVSESRDWTPKEIVEQQIVSEYVEAILSDENLELNVKGPYTAEAGNVAHLKTEFSFEKDEKLINTLIGKLHPTPAVCGMPKDKARELIQSIESHKREYYTGFLGPHNIQGCSSLYVNLRCMKITANATQLFVGGGLTNASDLELEWQETEHKAKTLLSVLEKF